MRSRGVSIQFGLLIIGLIFLVVSSYCIVSRWRKGFWKLGLKEASEAAIVIMGLVWILYFVVTLISLSIPFGEWCGGYIVGRNWSRDTLWILKGLPYFYVVSTVLLVLLVTTKLFTFRIKRTEAEKTFLEEERIRVGKRLGRFGCILRKVGRGKDEG